MKSLGLILISAFQTLLETFVKRQLVLLLEMGSPLDSGLIPGFCALASAPLRQTSLGKSLSVLRV